MSKGKFFIKIDSKFTEQVLIESCLNNKYSGIDWKIPFIFYALAKRWNLQKLNYYWQMLK